MNAFKIREFNCAGDVIRKSDGKIYKTLAAAKAQAIRGRVWLDSTIEITDDAGHRAAIWGMHTCQKWA